MVGLSVRAATGLTVSVMLVARASPLASVHVTWVWISLYSDWFGWYSSRWSPAASVAASTQPTCGTSPSATNRVTVVATCTDATLVNPTCASASAVSIVVVAVPEAMFS